MWEEPVTGFLMPYQKAKKVEILVFCLACKGWIELLQQDMGGGDNGVVSKDTTSVKFLQLMVVWCYGERILGVW